MRKVLVRSRWYKFVHNTRYTDWNLSETWWGWAANCSSDFEKIYCWRSVYRHQSDDCPVVALYRMAWPWCTEWAFHGVIQINAWLLYLDDVKVRLQDHCSLQCWYWKNRNNNWSSFVNCKQLGTTQCRHSGSWDLRIFNSETDARIALSSCADARAICVYVWLPRLLLTNNI